LKHSENRSWQNQHLVQVGHVRRSKAPGHKKKASSDTAQESPRESDEDEAVHNERNEHGGPHGLDTPQRGR
jgi:hypothetical protein